MAGRSPGTSIVAAGATAAVGATTASSAAAAARMPVRTSAAVDSRASATAPAWYRDQRSPVASGSEYLVA